MIEKQCSKCNKVLSIENFSRHHIMKDGYRNTCRLCCKKYKQDNKTNLAIKNKVAKKLHYLENKEFYQKRNKLYYQSNKENIILLNKKWKENNKERYEKMKKQHYINNKSVIAANCKLYYQNNKEKRNLYISMRKQNDVSFKLTCNLRTRISRILRNKVKSGSAIKDLGCSPRFLKQYLESKFKPGMTWNNYGLHGWHVDHIRPLASFDLSDSDQFKEACHYTNLQPLWAIENISKSDKIITE